MNEELNRILAIILFLTILFFSVFLIKNALEISYTNTIQKVIAIVFLFFIFYAIETSIENILHPEAILYIYCIIIFTVIFSFLVYLVCYFINMSYILFMFVGISIIFYISTNLSKKVAEYLNLDINKRYVSHLASVILIILPLFLLQELYFFAIPVPYKARILKHPTLYQIDAYDINTFHPFVPAYLYKVEFEPIAPFIVLYNLRLNPFKKNVPICQTYARMNYAVSRYYGYNVKYVFFFNVRVKKPEVVPISSMYFMGFLNQFNFNSSIQVFHVAVYYHNKVYDFELGEQINNKYKVVPAIHDLKFYRKVGFKSYMICNNMFCYVNNL